MLLLQSTEALRRQIEAAHRAHLQSQFPVNDNQLPATLEVNHQKRKTPAEFDLYSPFKENTVSEKTPICKFGSSPGGLQQDQTFLDQTSELADSHDGTHWVLEGTMRETYAQHSPNPMFPEPSSTVPNATLTQQRVLEGVLAPALLGSNVDAGRSPFQPDASIPWSEYLKSPTTTGEQPRSSAQHSHGSQPTLLPASGPILNNSSDLSISQSYRRASLTLVGCLSPQDKSTDVVNPQKLTIFPTDEVAYKATLPQATPSSTLNELRDKTPSSSRNSRKIRRISSPAPTSDDDLADLGLSKEQYKPRPSRSRSLKAGTQETTDYSVRPEKATKANRRRKSTPANTAVANPPSTSDRIQQNCDMGFTPSTSAKALKQNKGEVIRTVDWLITNGVANDELASHISEMSKGDDKQVGTNFDTIQYDGDRNAGRIVDVQITPTGLGARLDTVTDNMATAETGNLRSPAKVQVVIPARTPKCAAGTVEASRRKTKRRKTTLDQPEPTATVNAVTEAKAETRRGRGHPKKATETCPSAKIVNGEEEEGLREQVSDYPLLSVDGNARPNLGQQQAIEDAGFPNTTKPVQSPGSSQPANTRTAVVTSKSTPEPPELLGRPEVEPFTPERVKKPVPREQPSSNKAKVPHRVGLSKRTRIAPLLRVIKK
ncbi:uncharacterized protein M421DRAFT_279268 [Didymella exigua CBS 183.55]|uniref:UBA domain-containing protein n=1 Tax=Didymella exigua CBS 183.55 TaxID=1150837 RepID=A0A6A5RAW6_9PLEO|nr:uncharacterized protein M421DRAFT_279268 [Didymella exigua CBS 183.55]KAF1924459.1 hypothetical protein M421DRAFT_279268 [Didymella exigua CBS 183.55]